MTSPSALPATVRGYLAHPSLDPLWARLRDRLERNRLTVHGSVTVTLDDDGASRLGGLLATTVAAGPVRVSLPALDTALRRSAAATGLVAVLTALGGPLTDRAEVREQRQQTWAGVSALLDGELAAAGLATAPWVPEFVDAIRRAGLLTRAGASAAADAVTAAAWTLGELAPRSLLSDPDAVPDPRFELAELAGRVTGDAHGLDDGMVAGALVLRAVATAAGLPAPTSAADRRHLWELVGVIPDIVSGTVLVWGLRPTSAHPWAAMMRARADLGLVTHLTLQELRAVPADAVTGPDRVFACENPQVLQAAARAHATACVVSLAGNPCAAGRLLVRRLVATGVDVAYHGDFDWPGVAIAGRVFADGARPWRMTRADYTTAVRALPANARVALTGRPAATHWDPQLRAAMAGEGVAVHEESLLKVLLTDLS